MGIAVNRTVIQGVNAQAMSILIKLQSLKDCIHKDVAIIWCLPIGYSNLL